MAGYRCVSKHTNTVNSHGSVSTQAFMPVALAQFVVMGLTGDVLQLCVHAAAVVAAAVENRVATALLLLANQVGIFDAPVPAAHTHVVDRHFTATLW